MVRNTQIENAIAYIGYSLVFAGITALIYYVASSGPGRMDSYMAGAAVIVEFASLPDAHIKQGITTLHSLGWVFRHSLGPTRARHEKLPSNVGSAVREGIRTIFGIASLKS